MSTHITFKGLGFWYVTVTKNTQWLFVDVRDNDGCSATVEITCGEMSAQVVSYLSELVSYLQGVSIDDEDKLVGLLGLEIDQIQTDFPLATAISALRTALVQFACWHEGMSVTEGLGGTVQNSIELYANINRSILGDWTTSNFSAAAELAVSKGFTSIKCAPFDDMNPDVSRSDNLAEARMRVERVAAVKTVVGPEVSVLVDCHGYLNVQSAVSISAEMENLDVGWFEEPLRPNVDAEGLSVVTDKVNLPVAGGETGYGVDFFQELVSCKVVNIIMPDIKYCGGLIEAVKSGHSALALGGNVSLHCPSGPISQLASAHVTAALSSDMPLEHAINEAPWRSDMLTPPERIEKGHILIPSGIELGAILNRKILAKYGGEWSI